MQFLGFITAKNLFRVFWYGLILYLSYLMVLITLQYIPFKSDAAFLRIKDDVIGLWYYKLAFIGHVYTSIFILFAGIIQFIPFIQIQYPQIHRITGRVYAFMILLISGPCGLIMGYYANGAWISQISFCLLACLWMIFTFKGVEKVLVRSITEHRIWMIRSYALTLSALSLRLWKWIMVGIFQPRPMDVYHIVSWLGWVGNLLIAEIIIYRTIKMRKAV